jgi:hypothetical protein
LENAYLPFGGANAFLLSLRFGGCLRGASEEVAENENPGDIDGVTGVFACVDADLLFLLGHEIEIHVVVLARFESDRECARTVELGGDDFNDSVQ